MARLQVQLRLVVAPGAVGHGHHRLAALLEGVATGLQRHGLDEVTVGVVVDG